MRKDVECPNCEQWVDIDHEDGYGYTEGVKHSQQCPECDYTFVYTTHISFDYESVKSECLNGGDHDWCKQITYPKEYTLMECCDCGETRKPTKDEMLLIMNDHN